MATVPNGIAVSVQYENLHTILCNPFLSVSAFISVNTVKFHLKLKTSITYDPSVRMGFSPRLKKTKWICFIFTEGTNRYSHLILLVDPPSGRSEKDEVIHNNYAAVPIVVAANASSKQDTSYISALFL